MRKTRTTLEALPILKDEMVDKVNAAIGCFKAKVDEFATNKDGGKDGSKFSKRERNLLKIMYHTYIQRDVLKKGGLSTAEKQQVKADIDAILNNTVYAEENDPIATWIEDYNSAGASLNAIFQKRKKECACFTEVFGRKGTGTNAGKTYYPDDTVVTRGEPAGLHWGVTTRDDVQTERLKEIPNARSVSNKKRRRRSSRGSRAKTGTVAVTKLKTLEPNDHRVIMSAGVRKARESVLSTCKFKPPSDAWNIYADEDTTPANVLARIKLLEGTKYGYGHNGPDKYDCSASIGLLLRALFGIDISRQVEKIATVDCRKDGPLKVNKEVGLKRRKRNLSEDEMRKVISKLKVFDLVIFQNDDDKAFDHIGIYLGDGQFAHSASSRGWVTDSLMGSYYRRYFAGALTIKALD